MRQDLKTDKNFVQDCKNRRFSERGLGKSLQDESESSDFLSTFIDKVEDE